MQKLSKIGQETKKLQKMANHVIVTSFLKIAQQCFVCEYFLIIPIDVRSFKLIEGQIKDLQGVIPNTPWLRMTKKPGQDRVMPGVHLIITIATIVEKSVSDHSYQMDTSLLTIPTIATIVTIAIAGRGSGSILGIASAIVTIVNDNDIDQARIKKSNGGFHLPETQFQLGVWGRCKPPSGTRAKPYWGNRGRRPRKLPRFRVFAILKIP